jgi:uncharacterized protein YdeI (BOF family)
MNRLLFVLVLIGAGIVGLGFYQGWFHIGSDKADGKSNVTLSVDTEKFQADKKTAVAEVKGLGHQIKDQSAASASSSHDGKVVSVAGNKLVMTNLEGNGEHTCALTADAKVTCDGKLCKASDLKPGMRIRVTSENAGAHAATQIEALNKNPDFEKGA